MKKATPFADVAAAFDLQVQETGYFSRDSAITGIGSDQELNRLAFALSAQSPLAQQIVPVNRGWMVFALKERKAPDPAGFDDQKDGIMARLSDQEKQTTLSAWLDNLKSQGNVDINYDLIK